MILVGMKLDLVEGDASHKRAVTEAEAEALAKELGISYWEVSSKTGANVNELFTRMTQKSFMRLAELGKMELVRPSFNPPSNSSKQQNSSGWFGWLKRLLSW
jgi:hypothetical protein